jgi:lipopolysaccharide/colanic/teichoic acid biosynthesis glycosyltransferase
MIYKKYIKRLIDIVLSGIALVVLSPVILCIYLACWKAQGKPVFFTQDRVTLGARTFKLVKFRSMSNKTDANGKLLPDSERRTKVGTFLRNTSLDELPELVNIFKGDMSIIGPRPLLVNYNPLYTDYERNRFKVRGGLVPPEAMYDNPTPSWDDQLKWEADYALKCSFTHDVYLIYRVFVLLFKRSNASYGAYTRQSFIEERSNRKV